MEMRKGNIVMAWREDPACKWDIVIGQISHFDKDGDVAIYILDSKEPSVNPDGEYGLDWGDGTRWYRNENIKVIER